MAGPEDEPDPLHPLERLGQPVRGRRGARASASTPTTTSGPGSWVNNRPGFMTGSGMPQRFAREDGSMVDVFQAATQMTDESGQTYPFTPDTLLDRAIGAEGYYGFFVANMHTDQGEIQQDTALLASAQARGVPVVSSRDALEWIDGRNGSSFQDLAWSGGNTLSFTVAVGAGARNLTAMVPTAGPGGRVLTALRRGAVDVPFAASRSRGSSTRCSTPRRDSTRRPTESTPQPERGGHCLPDDAVPRHGRPLHALGRHDDRDAVQLGQHGDDATPRSRCGRSGAAAARRQRSRTISPARSCTPAGQSGVGRPGARRRRQQRHPH